MAAQEFTTPTGIALSVINSQEARIMALPKKQGKRAREELLHIPQTKTGAKSARRGYVAQTFLTDAQHVAFNEFLTSLNMSKAEYLRWLITDAVVNRRVPPIED